MRFLQVFISALTSLSVAVCAEAAYRVSIQQVGNNVVATGSGSVDVTGLNTNPRGVDRARVWASYPGLNLGPTVYTNFDWYIGPVSGPRSLGSGSEFIASSGTGVLVGFAVLYSIALAVPVGYVSGAMLGISTATWNNASFASLGLTPGTYVYSWGSGQHADTFTVQIGTPAALPESGTTAVLLCTAIAALFVVRRAIGYRRSAPSEGHHKGSTP